MHTIYVGSRLRYWLFRKLQVRRVVTSGRRIDFELTFVNPCSRLQRRTLFIYSRMRKYFHLSTLMNIVNGFSDHYFRY